MNTRVAGRKTEDMKQTFYHTLLVAGAFCLLAACSKEENGGMTDGRTELRLASGIEAVTRGDVQNTAIVADETVCAWVSDAGQSGTDAALYNAVKLTAQAGGGLAGTTPMYFPQTGNAVNIRALHGTFNETFTEGETAFPTGGVGFTVAENQSAGGDAYVKSDLLYAASNDVARSGNPTTVSLKFYHMLSKLELKIVRGEGVTDAVEKVTLGGVAVGGTFTPAEDADLTQRTARAAMIASGEQSATMTLGSAFWDEGTKTTNDAIVVPQTVGGKTMTFTLASGGKLVYTIPEGKAFESGRKHVYTVTLKLTGLEVTSSIEPWDDSEGETEGNATLPVPPIGNKTASEAAVGDFYMSDGSLVGKGQKLTEKQKKACIGIVFQTDKSRIGHAEKDALAAIGIAEPHGLVMAVKNAGTSLKWSNVFETTGATVCTTVADCYQDISGLKNTQTVYEFASYTNDADKYPAFKAVADFNTNNAVPENATEWFMPSAGQLWDLLENLGKVEALKAQRTNDSTRLHSYDNGDVCSNLNSWLTDITGADLFDGVYNYFWSSSEYSGDYARFWYVNSKGSVYCNCRRRGNVYDVRPVLAF